MVLRPIREDELKYDFIKLSLHGYSCSPNYYKMTQYYITIEAFHKQRYHDFVITNAINILKCAHTFYHISYPHV